jgi:ribosomal protein L11 methyltransferase
MTSTDTSQPSTTLYQYQLACPSDWCAYVAEQLETLPSIEAVSLCYKEDCLPGEEFPEALQFWSHEDDLGGRLVKLLAEDSVLPFIEWHVTQKTVEPESWAESWKRYWKPTLLHDTLWICPSWEPAPTLEPQQRLLWLDPGMAFGTGTHPSTQLVLQGLETMAKANPQQVRGQDLLDLGCGSGILALSAAQLHYRSIMAIDLDPLATQATKRNAERNKLAQVISVSNIPIGQWPSAEDSWDVMLVNILAPVIVELMPHLKTRLKPKGRILFAGLVPSQAESVIEAAKEQRLSCQIQAEQEGWVLLEAHHHAG